MAEYFFGPFFTLASSVDLTVVESSDDQIVVLDAKKRFATSRYRTQVGRTEGKKVGALTRCATVTLFGKLVENQYYI